MVMTAVSLRSQRIGFRSMDGAERMVGRSIDRIEFQRSMACIGEIVPCSGRDDNSGVIIYISFKIQMMFARPHLNNSPALFNTKELIDVRVHFQADVFAGVEAHQGNLQMPPCP